jgi:short-subunit dehydrogenase
VAAKHGQVGLMRSAAKELAERRIRVNTLHPGPTATPFQDDIEMTATGKSQADAAAIFDGMIPLGRHTTPAEIAQAALYLASDASHDHLVDLRHRRWHQRLTPPRATAYGIASRMPTAFRRAAGSARGAGRPVAPGGGLPPALVDRDRLRRHRPQPA